MIKTSASYEILAKYYENLSYDIDKNAWSTYICKLIEQNCKNANCGCDIACGDGLITLQLAKKYKMIGVDKSQNMLNLATKNNDFSQEKATFVQMDADHFSLNKKFDFVTIINDGANYIQNFEKLCKKVYTSLNFDGAFLFDFSSAYKLQNILGNNVFFDDSENLTMLWQNKLDKDFVDFDIVLFEKTAENCWQKSEESHRQYIYSKEQIFSALQSANFENIQCFDAFTLESPTQNSTRLQFIAKKLK